MLNEERIKIMTKLAMYEMNEGREDLLVNSYQKKDYISMNAWISAVWATIGYAVFLMLVGLAAFDFFMKHLKMSELILMGGIILAGYIVLLTAVIIISRNFFHKKHNMARKRVKKFNFYLTRLNKMYEKERR